MENCVCIGSVEGVMSYDAVNISRSTFVDIFDDSSSGFWDGTGVSRVRDNPIVTNSLFVGNVHYGVSGLSEYSDYNLYYNNGQNYHSCTASPHDYSSENGNEINVLWSESNSTGGLKYPVRIEDGSNLQGVGEGGADIGANIIKRYGVSGTLYGETGYNTLTDEDLWPFPNEDKIKERMKVYNRWDPYDNIDPNNASNPDTYVNGARGFCADGNGLYGGSITLTSYIWESLGNPCPADICNYSGTDFYPPVRTNGQPTGTLSSGTTSTSISLTTNESAICKYSTTAGRAYDSMVDTFSFTNSTSHYQTIIGLSDGNSYTYYVRCQDASKNTNTDDFEISFSVANAAQDTTPPVRINGYPAGEINAGTTTADISLSTDEDATCRYSSMQGVSYANMTNFTATSGTNHTTEVTGLENGLTYNYYVKCKDESNNINTDDYAITFSVANTQNSPSSSGGGSCFIATAAYGTPMSGEVKVLSRFRDKHLLRNYYGKIFVKLYYKYSPKMANYLRQKESLKSIVRIMLKPLVNITK